MDLGGFESRDDEGDVEIDADSSVVLRIYTRSGRLLWTHKVQGIRQGTNTYQWDGKDVAGAPLANGLYYYTATMESTGLTITKRTAICIMK